LARLGVFFAEALRGAANKGATGSRHFLSSHATKSGIIMKTTIVGAILITVIFSVEGRNLYLGERSYPGTGSNPLNYQGIDSGESDAFNEEYAAQQQYQKQILTSEQIQLSRIYSRDTWRNIAGTTNLARGSGWYEFQGIPFKNENGGVIFKGDFGIVLSVFPYFDQGTQPTYGEKYFMVENFPYIPMEDQPFQEMMAHFDGVYTMTNKDGEIVNIPKLDYGTPCEKIYSPEEIAAFKKRIADQKKAIADKILKSNRDLANKGDPYGLERMGERYRDGDDVPKDLTKAKLYLQRAADAGSDKASNELSQLTLQ
jgi:TPR repeat protein